MKENNPLGTQWSLEPSRPINLGIQPSSCPRILQTCTRTEKTLVPGNLSVKSIYVPEKSRKYINNTILCQKKINNLLHCPIWWLQRWSVSSKPSPNLQLSWRSAGHGKRVASNSPWHRKDRAPSAATPVDWAKWWWEMEKEINGQVCYYIVESN